MNDTKARQKLMFIDACRNDPSQAARSAAQRSFANLRASEGLKVLYSTREGRVSFEDDTLQQGIFSYFLVKGLRGEAAASDGLVTFQDLAGCVTEQMRTYTVERSVQVQVPYQAGESSGGFLLARAGPSPPPPPVPARIEPPGPKRGDVKPNPKDGQRYVWIPPGKFTMGCSPGDNECVDDEKPAHEVQITKGFWLAQTAVTVAAWKRYTRATGKSMPDEPKYAGRPLNPGWGDEQQPIVNVNWTDSGEFCRWASGRLPSEAEWEYAARAGSRAPRYGNLDAIAWYADNSGKQKIDSAQILTTDIKNYDKRLNENGNGPHPVALKEPNAWKLYDMLGNVWQWVSDWYAGKYYGQGENVDPSGPPGGQFRALRGGSWFYDPGGVRVSVRSRNEPAGRGSGIGCRCVWELP